MYNFYLLRFILNISFIHLECSFYVFGDDSLGGSNQFILLIGASIAVFIGFIKVSFKLPLNINITIHVQVLIRLT